MEMNEILSHSSRMHYYLFLILNSKLHFKILRRGRGSIQNSSISLRGVVCCFFFFILFVNLIKYIYWHAYVQHARPFQQNPMTQNVMI